MTTNLKVTAQQNLYNQDYLLWVLSTVNQIRSGNFEAVDWEKVVEELESLGNSDKRELESRLTVLLEHLLKLAYWDSEREYNARGWRLTIAQQRQQIKKLLRDSPSLKPYLQEVFAECYQDARQNASIVSELEFPIESPFTQEDTLKLN